MKLKSFKPHNKVSRKRVLVPAVRVTEKGYLILNAPFVREIGEAIGGFLVQFLYSKDEESIGILFYSLNADKKLPSEKVKHIICARDFLNRNELSHQINHGKFYPVEKIMSRKKEQTWAFYLKKDE